MAVAVWPLASVTKQLKVSEIVSPASTDAEKRVVADVAAVAIMVPSADYHANVIGAVPPVTDTVVSLVCALPPPARLIAP